MDIITLTINNVTKANKKLTPRHSHGALSKANLVASPSNVNIDIRNAKGYSNIKNITLTIDIHLLLFCSIIT